MGASRMPKCFEFYSERVKKISLKGEFMSLQYQRLELGRLQFKEISNTDDSIIALRKKWYWDCLFTRLTTVAFIRKVDQLSGEMIEKDRLDLSNQAKKLDSSLLPRGFQKGVAVLTIYLAQNVDASAQEKCLTKPKVRFAFFYLPSALEQSTGKTFILKETPIWGFIYYGKLKYLSQRLLSPSEVPPKEPLSSVGIGLTVFISFILLLEAIVIFSFLK
jgi:hypothetical protein